MPSTIKANKIKKFLLLVIVVWGFIIYANALHGHFQFDDYPVIVENLAIRNISDFSSIWKVVDPPTRFVALYSFAVNYYFHRLDVFGYHLVNVLIHIGNALLVYFFIVLLDRYKVFSFEERPLFKPLVMFLSAFIFLVHPLQTQAVSYITQRYASLAVFFYLSALCCYLNFRFLSFGKIGWLLSFLIFSTLGLLTKETVFTLPFIIFILEIFFMPQNKKIPPDGWKMFLSAGVLLIIVIPWLYRFDFAWVLGVSLDSSSHHGDVITIKNYWVTQISVICRYLQLVLFPIGQNLDYDFPVSASFFTFKNVISALAGIAVFYAAMCLKKKDPLVSFSIFWVIITLSVESSFIPIRHVIFEHRMYLPMVGVAIFLAVLLTCRFKNFEKCVITSCIIVLVLSFLTIKRNEVWQTEQKLWSDVVNKSPNKMRAYWNLGVGYARDGEYNKALNALNKAIEFPSVSFEVFNQRANTYYYLGEYEKALQDYNRVLKERPDYVKALNNRASIFLFMGDEKSAMHDVEKALKIKDDYVSAWVTKGNIYGKMNNHSQAIEAYNKALIFDPDNVGALINKGNKYALLGDYRLAIEQFNKSLKVDSKSFDAYKNRGNAYEMLGQYDRALADYTKMIEIKNNRYDAYLFRANLYRLINKPDDALKDYEAAIRLSKENGMVYFQRSKLFFKFKDFTSAYRDVKIAQSLGYAVPQQYIAAVMEKIENHAGE